VLVYSYADNDPGHFLLYHPQQDKWQLLGSAQPDIEPARMARMSFERIRARDGRDLPLWVTRPAGPTGKSRPAVVLVHRGPHTRGASWGWNADAQFLASRGYVVIEPEFRGSTGYGYRHDRAGWKHWGRGMIDDITDALRHVVAAGGADGSRVCVMGSSYGGYATLMSLVKEPDLYRCGIAHAAVSDPRHRFDFHWSDLDTFNRRVVLPLTMGDPVADAQMLVETSPLEQVKRIKAPILLMHGDDDVRVPIENSERMRDALKKAGKEVEWVVFVDEGRGFSRPANELDYWRRVEAFLAKHLR
jgi:dipeptidyl aminopeptidase/acylaminoacyl peptidase